MKESERRRNIIVNRLLSLNVSTKKELQDIVSLASVVCEAQVALMTLIKEDKQYVECSIGYDRTIMPLSESFCQYTILQDDILEINNAAEDSRFADLQVVKGDLHVRFYAGAPMKTKTGENIGSICVLDTHPKKLNDNQREMLKILSRQAITILEFELSLSMLKEEIAKVHESEMKLKTIFQSSHSCHLLVDSGMKILAFNKAAYNAVRQLTGQQLEEGKVFTSMLNGEIAEFFTRYFNIALSGKPVFVEEEITYGKKGTLWWAIDFNPAYDHNEEVIGVSLDATNTTERMRDRQNILTQNAALKNIAQIQSHQLRRPVANIISITDLLKDRDEHFDLHLQYLQTEVSDLNIQIHKIVELSSQSNITTENLH